MFKQDILLEEFYNRYDFNTNQIESVLKHFLKSTPVIVLPNRFEDLVKIKTASIPIKFIGNSCTATVEYVYNPNYSNDRRSGSRYNLINIIEQRTDKEVLKRIIRFNNSNTSNISLIQILEYGNNNDLYYTVVEYKNYYYSFGIGSIHSLYFNSDTFNYFRGLETKFDIFSDLSDAGIYCDDEANMLVEKKDDEDDEEDEEDENKQNIETLLAKYDETINLIEERNRPQGMGRGSHV